MQAIPPTHLADLDDDSLDVLADDTFDAFRAAGAAADGAREERARTRRGGPRTALPLLPIIGLVAGVGIAYVAQTAHLTQTSYQETGLAATQSDLQHQSQQLGDELGRLRSPARIVGAAQRLGLKPPAHWVYVASVPPPIAAPVVASAQTGSGGGGAVQHVLNALAGTYPGGPSPSPDAQDAGSRSTTP